MLSMLTLNILFQANDPGLYGYSQTSACKNSWGRTLLG